MPDENSVLVAIMNNAADFAIAQNEHWYRIPKDKAEKWGKPHWPPKWLAFYQTRVFSKQSVSEEACVVKYYAHVHELQVVRRRELLP